MAFEVFDDVAFYWFLMSCTVAFVIPISYSFLSTWKWSRPEDWTRKLGSCKAKMQRNDKEARAAQLAALLGWRGMSFVFGWLLLFVLLIKLSSMQGEEMFSFNPYTILDVEEGADPKEIKKAFRRFSLLYHPDKNQYQNKSLNAADMGPAEAADMFIKVTKAHDVLTDEATRDNYEKYGNPDGYHGTSVTIGLPSWLTNKDNELAILVAYFVVMIVVIPVVVGLW